MNHCRSRKNHENDVSIFVMYRLNDTYLSIFLSSYAIAMIVKSLRETVLSHCGSLSVGPLIRTNGGSRAANPLIFAQSVVSPQNCGGVSAAATDVKIVLGVSQPARIDRRASSSSRPSPVTGSGRSCNHRLTAAGIQGNGALVA